MTRTASAPSEIQIQADTQALPSGSHAERPVQVHGGKSTPEGLERSRRANWKHGYAALLALRYLRMLAEAGAFQGDVHEETSRDQGALDAPILSQSTNQARRGTKCSVPGCG
jgi:hypothetical protein